MNKFTKIDDESVIFVLTNEINQFGVKHDTVANSLMAPMPNAVRWWSLSLAGSSPSV